MNHMTIGALLILAAFFGYQSYQGSSPGGALPRPSSVAAPDRGPGEAPAQRDKLQECLDTCEQKQTVTQSGAQALSACRAACGVPTPGGVAEGKPAPRPYEPIRRITRAPADHARQAPSEWR